MVGWSSVGAQGLGFLALVVRGEAVVFTVVVLAPVAGSPVLEAAVVGGAVVGGAVVGGAVVSGTVVSGTVVSGTVVVVLAVVTRARVVRPRAGVAGLLVGCAPLAAPACSPAPPHAAATNASITATGPHQKRCGPGRMAPNLAGGHIGYVLFGQFLAVSNGSDALFYPLVFLHIISALAGFGSIGFAGTYASRAANLATAPDGERRPPGAGVPEDDPGGTSRGEKGHSLVAAAGAGQERGPGPAGEGPAGGGPAGEAETEGGMVDPEVEEVVRYFRRPARFWKAVLAVPVFGVLALVSEPGGGGLDQVWDLTALLVWGCAAVVAAGVVAPSLRHMSTVLLSPGPSWLASAAHRARLSRYGRLASRGAAACDVLFFVALALMIWRP
jgi:hypothetical protein